MNRNPVLKLGIRENRHEQNVNFYKNQVQIIKIFGCIVEGVFVVAVTPSYISLPIKSAHR